MAAIEVHNITKSYKDFTAVSDTSFCVEQKEIFGLLGPNGSGKTTILEILVGLKKPSSGTVSVLNMNPFKNRKKLASFVGVQLDYTSLPLQIKVKEAVALFAAFYGSRLAKKDILKRFGLDKKENVYYGRLSWGEKQRLGLALACLGEPKILFLDEPTSRLDPIGKEDFLAFIQDLKGKGKTIFINTHDLQEAENLCDRIGIMNKGKLCAINSPENLIKDLGYKFKIVVNDTLNKDICIEDSRFIRTKTHTHILTNVPDKVIFCLEKMNKDFSKTKINLSDVFLIVAGEEYHA